LIGLSFALVAVGLAMFTGNPVFDALGSIAIGVLLIIIALMIGIQVKRLLIGQGVDPATHKAIVNFLEEQEEVNRLFNLITLQLGQDVMVAIKAEMCDYSNQNEMIKAINRCEERLKTAFPQIVWSFFEPDLRD
jgi:divalent metal cation (Fe/Co/Zn/Cd) transporter